MNNSMKFIREHECHLTLEEVSNATDISLERLTELENLDSLESVDVATMIKISKALSTSVERLLRAEENDFVLMFAEYVSAEERKKNLITFIEMHQASIDEALAKIDGADENAADKIFTGFLNVTPVIYNSAQNRAIDYNDAPENIRTDFDAMSRKKAELGRIESRLLTLGRCCGINDDGRTYFSAYTNPLKKKSYC